MKLSATMLQEINKHIDRKSNRLLRKGFFLGIFIMLGFTLINTYAFTVETNFTNAVQYIKSIFVTANGKKTGNLLVAMNTGGKALIVNGSTQLLGDVSISGTLNANLNELDPIWTQASSGYYTKDESDAKFITGELDNKWMSISGSYYTKTQIDAKGYISGYTETDPQVGTVTTSGNRCKSDGSKINCTEPTPSFSYTETDPQINDVASAGICKSNGSVINCDQAGGTTYWQDAGGGDIFYDAGNVSIPETLYLTNDVNHGIKYDIGIDGPTIFGRNGGALGWRQYGSSGIALRWNQQGNVGIGTNNPLATLDVNGSIKIKIIETPTAIYSIADDDMVIICTGGFIQAPAANMNNRGKIYIIKAQSGGCGLDVNGLGFSMASHDTITIISNGTERIAINRSTGLSR